MLSSALSAAAVMALAASSLVAGQTYSHCNPIKGDSPSTRVTTKVV